MGTRVIVLPEPVIDDDLNLHRCREPLGIEDLTTQGTVEALVISVHPCTARLGIAWRCPERG